jgi:hypothetical protein
MDAFLILLSMSEMGSVIDIFHPLPAGLADAGYQTPVGHIPEADSADAELAEEAAGSTAQRATIVLAHPELGGTLLLLD